MSRAPLRTDPARGRFVAPNWSAPLEMEVALHAIPANAKISGMFIAPLLAELERRCASIIPPRPRYVPFQFYPVREHAQLLVDTAARSFADLPLRLALRKMGRAAPLSFIASTLGKVILGSSQGVHGAVAAFAKAYELNMRPGRATILETHTDAVVVRLEDVHYFLDSHHIGAFEGAMKYAGVRGRVRIDAASRSTADLLLQW